MKYLEHDSGELLKSERSRAIEARGWTKKQFGKKTHSWRKD